MSSDWLPALLALLLGAGLGGALRFVVTRWLDRHALRGFPPGTLFVNASGAFLIGLLAGAWDGPVPAADEPLAPWLGLAAGLLGAYTTVSSYALQGLGLLDARQRLRALAYLALTPPLCLGLAVLGFVLA